MDEIVKKILPFLASIICIGLYFYSTRLIGAQGETMKAFFLLPMGIFFFVYGIFRIFMEKLKKIIDKYL